MTTAFQILLYAVFTLPSYLPQMWDAVATARLNTRLAAIRAAGDPTTMKELAERVPDPPEGKNAAPFYNAAFKQMDALDDALDGLANTTPIVGEPDLPPPGVPVPPVMLGAIERYLAAAKPIFAPLDKATDLEQCKFQLDFTKGMALELAHLSKMRAATRLYALRAVLHTEKGEAAEAADVLARGLATAEALRHEPILISALVRIACLGIAANHLERTVSRLTLSDKALQTLGDRLAGAADRKIAIGAMVGERCFGMDIYQTQVLGGNPEMLQALGNEGTPFGLMTRVVPQAYFKSDLVAYIDIMNAYVDASRKPYPESVLEGARIGDTVEKRIPRYYVVSRMIVPALGRVYSTAQRYMAQCDTARVAVACLRHRAKHGRLPEALDALVPAYFEALPPDPFTGKALHYRKDAAGFVVYAFGENKKDDGGNTDRGDNRRAPDVGFRVRWPRAEF